MFHQEPDLVRHPIQRTKSNERRHGIYQRLRPRLAPPPPPPLRSRLPPPKFDSRGLASFTLMFRPLSSESLTCRMALATSSAVVISTKPKPFDCPENLSVITVALCT